MKVELQIFVRLIDDQTFLVLVSTDRTPFAFQIISKISQHVILNSNSKTWVDSIQCEESGLSPEEIPESPSDLLHCGSSSRTITELVEICKRDDSDNEKAIFYSFYFGSASSDTSLREAVASLAAQLAALGADAELMHGEVSGGLAEFGHSVESGMSLLLSDPG